MIVTYGNCRAALGARYFPENCFGDERKMSLLGTTDIGLFIFSGLLLNITPGADLLYITTCSAMQGKKAGIVAALGIGTGCIVHVVAATCGLSVILVSSSVCFRTKKQGFFFRRFGRFFFRCRLCRLGFCLNLGNRGL